MKTSIATLLFIAWSATLQQVRSQDMVFAAAVNYAAEVDAPADVVDFLLTANDARLMNMEGGTIAAKNGRSQKIKQYATDMVNDQALMLGHIKKMALMRGLDLPDYISEERKRHCDKLAGWSAKKFDRKFIRLMIEERKRDLEFFNYAAHSSDPEVSAFATLYIPLIKSHLKDATALKRRR